MIVPALLVAALLLAIERVSYIYIWHNPESFKAFCQRPIGRMLGDNPVDVLQKLFYVFKFIQLGTFLGWCILFAEGHMPIPTAGPLAWVIGLVLLIVGQVLNFGVFYQLGKEGVFYGVKLGHEVPWCEGFPFSVMNHPQYIGTVISIWGLLIMRFPNPDWIALPILQTVYYLVAMRYEG